MSGRRPPARSSNGRRNGGSRLSVPRGAQLGLALIIGGWVWNAAETFFGERQLLDKTLDDRLSAMESRFLSKEVFTTEIQALRREADMRQDEVLRRLDAMERAGSEGPK